jgi:hypothetical protein
MIRRNPSRVFVTQQPKPNAKGWMPNLTPASQFGQLQYVFATDEIPSASPAASMLRAYDQLSSFDPEADYVLWPNTGDPIAAWTVMLALARKVHKIKVLYWERKMENGVRSTTDGYYTVKELCF